MTLCGESSKGLFDSDSEAPQEALEKAPKEAPKVSFKRMGPLKTGGQRFEIAKYDGRTDYLLWERQVKGALQASGLGRMLKPKPEMVEADEWIEMQEIAVSTVIMYLQPQVIKQLKDDFKSCTELFEALVAKYHWNELSNFLYTSLKLMSFKMKDAGGKIQDHVDSFNDLVIDLQNLGEDLSDERKALHLLSSLPTSYQSLS